MILHKFFDDSFMKFAAIYESHHFLVNFMGYKSVGISQPRDLQVLSFCSQAFTKQIDSSLIYYSITISTL